jgi:GNAT superfamily N-acetyltransferase
MFDTKASPVTQSFGLGVFEKVTRAEMDRIESFFQERGAPVFHEISPLADTALVELLNERGYQPLEFTSVMYRPAGLPLLAPRNERIQVRPVRDGEQELWAKTAAAGWRSEHPELEEFLSEMGQVSSQRAGGISFLAELDGQAIAAGALSLHPGVALLAGACTIPEARRQGAQLALLEARLRYAAEHGCGIAMMGAQPGSASQRNAERHGFRIAYTRIKWRLGRAA